MEKTTRRNKADKRIFIIVLLLTIFGWLMVINAHSQVWQVYGFPKFLQEVFKITFFYLVGLFCLVFLTRRFRLDKFKKKLKFYGLIIGGAMLITLLIPAEKGAHAWIRIPGVSFSIQPVEFLKIYYIIYLACYFDEISHKAHQLTTSQILLKPAIITLSIFLFVFVIQNDLGSSLILMIISYVCFLAAPIPKLRSIKILSGTALVVAIILFYLAGPTISNIIYNMADTTPFKAQLLRIAILFDPLRDVHGSGFHLTNSLVSFSSGGIFGRGFGNSLGKFILPEPYNDAILPVISEELGLIGVILLFAAYFSLVMIILSYAESTRIDVKTRIVLVGISAFIMAQLFVNAGGMVGLIPMTGVTLLFVSSGGTSLLVAFISIGIVQALIRRNF